MKDTMPTFVNIASVNTLVKELFFYVFSLKLVDLFKFCNMKSYNCILDNHTLQVLLRYYRYFFILFLPHILVS